MTPVSENTMTTLLQAVLCFYMTLLRFTANDMSLRTLKLMQFVSNGCVLFLSLK